MPAEIDGLPLEPVPEAAAQIAADPNLRREAGAVAVARVVALTAETEDFAVASIVELGDGVFDPAFFGAWRDSYDESACEPAGGVARRAETRIGGRDVSIATCEQGARTYHVHLADPDRMVSITSVGDRDFGERVIAGIPAGS